MVEISDSPLAGRDAKLSIVSVRRTLFALFAPSSMPITGLKPGICEIENEILERFAISRVTVLT